MNALSDELVMLIWENVDSPAHLSITCRRFHRIGADPYVRASWFIARYGKLQAIYWALGRGKLLNKRVLEILVSSGAHLSRYLLQCVFQGYARPGNQFFLGRKWPSHLRFSVFAHLQTLSADIFGDDVDISKGEDDGSLFERWLAERKNPGIITGKKVEWEAIFLMFDKFGFLPFSPKDPIFYQLPLALALEPRLLPLAVKNGFSLSEQYRDFIFRKMFEKSTTDSEDREREIIQNVRELGKIDASMFLSRTVAAEICMEAKSNVQGYSALKKLDSQGQLRFPLSELVADLIKLFVRTRSVTSKPDIIALLQSLYSDFPSPRNPHVRLVLLLTIFCGSNPSYTYSDDEKYPFMQDLVSKLKKFQLLPLARQDLINILTNPFAENAASVLAYARSGMSFDDVDVEALAAEVTIACLEIACKGKLLHRLCHSFPTLEGLIASTILRCKVAIDDLPDIHNPQEEMATKKFKLPYNNGCITYSADRFDLLDCARHGGEEDLEEERDAYLVKARNLVEAQKEAAKKKVLNGVVQDDHHPGSEPDVEMIGPLDNNQHNIEDTDDINNLAEAEEYLRKVHELEAKLELGSISQDTLTHRIKTEEAGLRPTRRRLWRFRNLTFSILDSTSRMTYPADALPVENWILDTFGAIHAVTSVFMTHGILNGHIDPSYLEEGVPITMEHFHMLAKLGREPPYRMWTHVEDGAPFYLSYSDFLTKNSLPVVEGSLASRASESSKGIHMKIEADEQNGLYFSPRRSHDGSISRKRPRRSVASTNVSYLEVDSDDEAIAEDGGSLYFSEKKPPKILVQEEVKETPTQLWFRHLNALLRDEEKKWRDKKKVSEKNADGKPVRVPKTEFLKSLTFQVRQMRLRNTKLYGSAVPDIAKDDSDGEYILKTAPKAKRRKTSFAADKGKD